ncbi:MAG: hypothetical protein WA268_06010 [Xanthobacteraceae bacterium]
MLWKMWRAVALILAIGLQSQAVRADENPLWRLLFGHEDPRLTATGIGLGIATTGASYALTHKHGVPAVRTTSAGVAFGVTTFGCMVLYPIIGTIAVHRELTPREAYSGIAGCIIPFIGGWIVDQTLPHDPWYDGLSVRHAGRPRAWHHASRKHHYRRHTKQHVSAASIPLTR